MKDREDAHKTKAVSNKIGVAAPESARNCEPFSIDGGAAAQRVQSIEDASRLVHIDADISNPHGASSSTILPMFDEGSKSIERAMTRKMTPTPAELPTNAHSKTNSLGQAPNLAQNSMDGNDGDGGDFQPYPLKDSSSVRLQSQRTSLPMLSAHSAPALPSPSARAVELLKRLKKLHTYLTQSTDPLRLAY